jgi:hypothetical protein
MRRRLAVIAVLPILVLTLSAVTATTASAAPPAQAARHAGAPYSEKFAAGAACPFAVRVSGIDDTTVTPLPDGNLYAHGYFDVVVTNLRTGKHVFRVASGPGVIDPFTAKIYATGRWVIQVGPRPGHKARLDLITGKFTINLVDGVPYDLSPKTTVVNLCQLVK